MLRALAVRSIVVGVLLLPASASATSLSVGVGAANGRVVASADVRSAPRGAVAVLETRDAGRRTTRALKRVRGRRLELAWQAKSSMQSADVRLLIRSRRGKRLVASRWQPLDLRAAAPPLVKIQDRQVQSVPAPGAPGVAELTGSVDAKVGDVLALGSSERAPDGLLARVTSVETRDGTTRLGTTPVPLTDVVPSGAIEIHTSTLQTARRAAVSPFKRNALCTNNATLRAEGSINAGATTDIGASWTLTGGFTARFEGVASADSKLLAGVSGGASCTLTSTPLYAKPISLGTITFTVGAVPVVVRPELQVYLQAKAETQAAFEASLSASVKANAGMRFEGGSFKPVAKVKPEFKAQPPALTATGTAEATVTPRLELALYGMAGPRLDVTAGLRLTAETGGDPWWKLTAPIDVGAQLRLHAWKLNIDSGRLSLFTAEPVLLSAPSGSQAPATTPVAATPAVCGTVTSLGDGSTLDIVVAGGGACGDAAAVMQEYFRQAAAGGCEGNGNACVLEIKGHLCSARSGIAAEQTRIGVTCIKDQREIQARLR